MAKQTNSVTMHQINMAKNRYIIKIDGKDVELKTDKEITEAIKAKTLIILAKK